MSASMDRYWELLSAYVDNEVTDAERTEVERLLAEDKQAAALFTRLSATRNMLSSIQPVSAPPRIRHRVNHAVKANRTFFSRLRRMLTPRGLRMPVLSYASGILVIVLAILFTTVITENTNPPETPQFADSSVGERKSFRQKAMPTDELAQSQKEESTEEEGGGSIPEAEAAEELLADLDAEEDTHNMEPARPEPRVSATQPAIGLAAAPEPVIISTAERTPMYRAEVIQAYSNSSPDMSMGSDDGSIFTTTNGTSMRNDFAAEASPQAGEIHEPPVDFGTIGLPILDFPHFQTAFSGSVLVSGTLQVASDGRILSYRLTGPSDARELIEHYAAHLAGTRIMPARYRGQSVRANYNFIATIYRIEETID